jgi:hypothetical protein
VADAIDVIGIVVRRPVRVVFEMIVIAGLGQLFRRWYIVRHIAFLAVLRKHHLRFAERHHALLRKTYKRGARDLSKHRHRPDWLLPTAGDPRPFAR